MSQKLFNEQITHLIQSSFLSLSDYKAHKAYNLSQIASGSLHALNLFTSALKLLLSASSTTPEIRLISLRFLKEAMDLNIAEFLLYFKQFLYPILLKDGLFQYQNKDENRGRFFFGMSPDLNTKVTGNSYLKLLLESIEIWAFWYPKDTVLTEGYKELVQKGVSFPTEKTYYLNKKDLIGDRVPVYKSELKGEKSEGLLKEEILIEKGKLAGVLKEKEINKEELKEIIENMKGFLEKLEFLALEKEVFTLEKIKNQIEQWISAYETSLSSNGSDFSDLKACFFELNLLKNKKPPPIEVLSLSYSEIPDKLNENQIKRELLTTKAAFERNIDGFMSKMKPLHRIALKPLVNILTGVLKDEETSLKSRFLSLLFFKVIMSSELEDIPSLLGENAYGLVVELAKPTLFQKELPLNNNRSSIMQSEEETATYKDFLSSQEEVLPLDLSALAAECLFIWAKTHPLTLEGEDSIFWETFTVLKELGANFSCFERGNFDYESKKSLLDKKSEEVGLIIEELKDFLIETKKTVKNIEFLPEIAIKIIELKAFFGYFKVKSPKIAEMNKFLKEFSIRYKKFNENLINYTQFKRRFLKFLGYLDQSSSKISNKSKISTSETNPIQKAFKKEENIFHSIGQKKPITQKTPQNSLFDDLQRKSFITENKLSLLYKEAIENPLEWDIFAFIAQGVFESNEGDFLCKINILRLMKLFMESNNSKMAQFIHDYTIRSLSIAIYNANFLQKGGNNDKIEEFSLLSLEALKEWAFNHKTNIFLCNFKKTWGILTEDLMIEIPEKLIDKSSVFPSPNIRFINRKNSINSISPILMKESLMNPNLKYLIRKKGFGELFEEFNKKLPLKWYGKGGIKGVNKANSGVLEWEARLIKENRDLKEKLRKNHII